MTRYRPETDSEPHWQEYDVPLRKEWTVLDGLNHVKDEVDATLSFRWSCRMGICGSCGMTVDGEPKLTCAHLPERLRARARSGRAARQLPGHPRPRRRHRRLHAEAAAGQAVDHPRRRQPTVEIDGEYLQTPEELDAYQQFSMCINCMLCYAACPVYGLDPEFIGPAAIALAERYDLDSRDRGVGSGSTCSSSTRASGAARSSASARGCAPSTSTRAAHPALQAEGGEADGEGVPAAAGCSMTAPGHTGYAAYRLYRPHLDLVVDPEAVLLRVRDARAEQHLRRLVRGLPAAARLRRRPGARRPTSASSTGPPRRGSSRSTSSRWLSSLLHVVTWFSLTPKAMVVRVMRPEGARRSASSPRSTSAWWWCRRSWSGW